MAKNLVIVESPAKARTISRFLKPGYAVKATLGHVRDLPEKELGVDIENGFAPKYLVLKGKSKVIKEIKAAAKDSSVVYLATDPDREGEAISWHLVQAARLGKIPVKRVVFHEVTKEAVEEAFRNPRKIDLKLVNAQQARRILDRLVGYKLSPILWRKVMRGLSAGRVQSAALKMIVEREQEVENFITTEYWSIDAELKKRDDGSSFRAKLVGLAGDKKLEIRSKEEADKLSTELKGATYVVAKVRRRTLSRQPVAPFITSTLQQEAWRKLHFDAKHTMVLAQQLYEGLPIGEEEPVGLITYMRTDSTHVSSKVIAEVRDYIAGRHGSNFLPPSPRTFKKVKGAQEAHEAIRPTLVKREPSMLQSWLTSDQFKLYELVWKRMVASQMAAALLDTTAVEIEARKDLKRYLFRATSSAITFPGFLILYSEGKDEEEKDVEERPLPELTQGDKLDLLALFPEQHFTKPPLRYTEATLVKALEGNGIGRPSTFAPILHIIQEREYVEKEKGHFKPKVLGFIVTDLLKENFPGIVDLGFTAQMEEKLDEIAWGHQEWVPVLREFYDPFAKELEKATLNMPKVKPAAQPTHEVCEKCASPMVIKQSRYGRFLSCSNYPKCKNARPLPIEANCPRCGAKLIERRTKSKRLFYGCVNFPKCDFAIWEKPLPQLCPECSGLLIPAGKNTVKCIQCRYRGNSLEEPV